MDVYPLKFEPIFKPKVWGGRNLQRLFGKPLPPGRRIGESWELADVEHGQSVVADGPARGLRLGDLATQWGRQLLGEAALFEGRFPLLIKFLDAEQNLSVQVHPGQAMARKLGPTVRVKHEAWYIVEARGDAAIYHGVNEPVTREAFAAAIDSGHVQELLRRIPVQPGQWYYLPSGTLHALGAGVVVAEVQTPSDITYRVYDWGRTGRKLHIDKALQSILLAPSPPTQPASPMTDAGTTTTRLVRCESFVIQKVHMPEGTERPAPGGQMAVWIVLKGRGRLTCQHRNEQVPFRSGDVLLLPAGLGPGQVAVDSDCEWLDVTVPSDRGDASSGTGHA